jgi:ABC-2 type transport system ATP-binding protein
MNNNFPTIIQVSNLHKNFADIKALDDVSFDIKKGEIFGLIGPDGAGKSTLFKLLSGVMKPDKGNIRIFGDSPSNMKHKIGFLTQQFSFYTDLSLDENIRYSAGIRRISKKIYLERKEKYLSLMGLENFGSRLAGQLSGGMKQKLALCCILIFEPEILILDEPTCGVDPISRREFWDILSALSLEMHTIVIATPYLDEAERCNRIAFTYQGKITQIGTPKQLKDSTGLTCYEVRSQDNVKAEILIKTNQSTDSNIIDVQTFGDRLDVLVKNPDAGLKEISRIITQNISSDYQIIKSKLNLENVFVSNLRNIQKEPEYIPFTGSNTNNLKNNEIAIAACNLNKNFGNFNAVRNLSLQVKYGEIYGLLGANGAGKTTTIKMLCGLMNQTSGKIALSGESTNIRTGKIRNKIGYMSQKFTLYDDLTIYENLMFYCGVYNVDRNKQKEKIDWVLNMSGLSGQEDMLTGNLPGGWKQRVSFGASIMHEPEILFLDEPTSGVDPLARRQFWKLIEELSLNGTAILVTTHYLEEAEHCNRMAFMSAGSIIAEGTPNEIKSSQPGILYELEVSSPQKATFILKEAISDWQVSMFGDKVHIVIENNKPDMEEIKALLKNKSIELINIYQYPFSLEDAFIGIIERSKSKGEKE